MDTATMTRQFLNLVAAALMLLSVVIGIMWVRSYFAIDTFCNSGSWQSDDGPFPRWLESSDGSLSWRYYPHDNESPVTPFDHAFLGFRYYYGRDRQPPGTGTYFCWFVFAVPYWFVFTLAAAPASRLLMRQRIRCLRRRRNCCVKCGYDLRATPNRCPECGAMATASLLISGK